MAISPLPNWGFRLLAGAPDPEKRPFELWQRALVDHLDMAGIANETLDIDAIRQRIFHRDTDHPTARLLDPRTGILGSLPETAQSESAEDFELAPGDRLILYTDGLAEVFNGLGEMLGVEGLQGLILESAQRPIQELKQAILNGVKAWSAGPLSDDVSLVIVEVR